MCDLITGWGWGVNSLVSKCKNATGQYWISCAPIHLVSWKSLPMWSSFISIFTHKRRQGCSAIFPPNSYNSLSKYIWHVLYIISVLTLPCCQGNRHQHCLWNSEKKPVKEQKYITYCGGKSSLLWGRAWCVSNDNESNQNLLQSMKSEYDR